MVRIWVNARKAILTFLAWPLFEKRRVYRRTRSSWSGIRRPRSSCLKEGYSTIWWPRRVTGDEEQPTCYPAMEPELSRFFQLRVRYFLCLLIPKWTISRTECPLKIWYAYAVQDNEVFELVKPIDERSLLNVGKIQTTLTDFLHRAVASEGECFGWRLRKRAISPPSFAGIVGVSDLGYDNDLSKRPRAVKPKCHSEGGNPVRKI